MLSLVTPTLTIKDTLPLLLGFVDGYVITQPPNQIIDRVGDIPYIERWFIGRKMTVPFGGGHIQSVVENIYVHRYGRSDHEDLHDHPWDNASLILRGHYVEETPEGSFRRNPGDIILRRAEEQHRITVVEPGTLTLFATLKKRREWGFWENGEFVHWREWSASVPQNLTKTIQGS